MDLHALRPHKLGASVAFIGIFFPTFWVWMWELIIFNLGFGRHFGSSSVLTHSGTSLPSTAKATVQTAAMMSILKTLTLWIALVYIAIALGGCGCDTEAGTKCGTDYAGGTFDMSTAEACKDTYGKAIETYGTCLDDAGCADDDGMKTAVDEAKKAVDDLCKMVR
jgi:hypothetical protein